MNQTYKYARDFFTALADPAPLDDIFDALHRYIKSIGYPTIYFGIREDPTHPAPASMENRLIYARDDDGWWSEYSDNRYYLDDPYYELGRQIRGNFLFTPPDSLTERQRRFLEYATKRKKMNGFAFSDQMISGRVWGCSASGGEKKPNEPQIIEIKSAFYAWNRHFNSQLSGAFAKQH
ncbi:MAG: autoinducer binding domain-containing protein, partial [Pseudomonadota bacterium]